MGCNMVQEWMGSDAIKILSTGKINKRVKQNILLGSQDV